jgi:hypothetical protein
VEEKKRDETGREDEVGQSQLAKSRVRQQKYYAIYLAFISGPFLNGECWWELQVACLEPKAHDIAPLWIKALCYELPVVMKFDAEWPVSVRYINAQITIIFSPGAMSA